jgi:GAF domain-containing protein
MAPNDPPPARLPRLLAALLQIMGAPDAALRETLPTICDQLVAGLTAEAAVIFLYHPVLQTLEPIASGPTLPDQRWLGHDRDDVLLAVDELARDVFLAGQPLGMDRSHLPPRWQANLDPAQVPSVLVVPLPIAGLCWGVVAAVSTEPHHFQAEDDVPFLTAAATWTGLLLLRELLLAGLSPAAPSSA